jgi:hypothetical protein
MILSNIGYVMRHSFLFALIAVCATLAGCASLQTSFNVLTFDEDENSGKATQQYMLMSVISDFAPESTSNGPLKTFETLLDASDSELSALLNEKCRPIARALDRQRISGQKLFGDVAIQAASILYNAVFSELEAGAKKLQQRSTPAPYSVRVSAGTGFGVKALQWTNVKCIVIQRRWIPDAPKGSDAPVDRPRPFTAEDKGLTIVLQKIPKGNKSSTLRPIYLRMDNAVALTGAGTDEKPASIQANLAFTLSAAEMDKGKLSVVDVAKYSFPAFNLPLGRTAQACRFNDPVMACEYESDLIRDPATDADAISIAASVKEIGSAAKAEDRAKAGIDALKAISKPFFDAFVAEIKAASK